MSKKQLSKNKPRPYRRSSVGRCSSWYGLVARRSNWRRSSSHRRKQFRNWVAQADRDEGRREDGLTTVEREELSRLRRENRQLKLERAAGCNGYVSKPYSPRDLLAKVRSYLA
jgi:hypothetical protein